MQELGVDGKRLEVEFDQFMAPIALVSVLPEQQMLTVDSSIDEVSIASEILLHFVVGRDFKIEMFAKCSSL